MEYIPANNVKVVNKKLLGLDFDRTLVQPKGSSPFPINAEDWKFLFPIIPTVLQEYNEKGFTLVIFTNQSKIWKIDQIKQVVKKLEPIPIHVFIATDKKYYKPNLDLFNFCLTSVTEFELKNSLFIGDALGRKSDFSDSDKVFAERIGIPILSPAK